MGKNAKKYFITTEMHEIFIIRRAGSNGRGYCRECAMDVEMLSLDAAVSRTQIRSGKLFGMIESGEIHALETSEGYLLLCEKSLKRG